LTLAKRVVRIRKEGKAPEGFVRVERYAALTNFPESHTVFVLKKTPIRGKLGLKKRAECEQRKKRKTSGDPLRGKRNEVVE